MAVAAEEQETLFDLKSKQINPYWVNPKQPLLVPANPLHVKAHRLQLLLERLDHQAEKNGAQFNSTTYLAVLNEYTKSVQLINEGKSAHDLLEQGNLGEDGKPGRQASLGNTDTTGLDIGVSPDNPIAG